MSITFEKYLELAELARVDKSLHENHSNSVVLALKAKKTENTELLDKIAGTFDEYGLIARLERENRQIDHALTAYA